MAQSIITQAFETYKAQQEAIASPVELDEFVLALVPGQDSSVPIERNESMPSASHIKYRAPVTQHGFVGPNSVVYSLIMDTRIGDFEFNWIGLRSKKHNALAAIMHIPTIAKFKSVPGVQNGNSVTRSVLMNYQDAKQISGITVDASTWQIDFTSRLFGIDEAERLANIDVFGQASFLDVGFKVEKSGGHYIARLGRGYVGGLRCHLNEDVILTNVVNSSGVYVDATWHGGPISQWHTKVDIKVSQTALNDYVDDDGYQHYVTKIADINRVGAITDRRYIEGFARYYQQHAVNEFLAKKIDKSSVTDSVGSTSRALVASAKGLKTAYDKGIAALNRANAAYDLAAKKWVHQVGSTKQAGTVQLSTSVSSSSTTLAATPSAIRLAYKKAVEALNKANTKWSYVQASLTVSGATKLSSAVNSSSEALAATSKSVKVTYDKAVAGLKRANTAYDLAASKWEHRAGTTRKTGTVRLSTSVNSTSTTLASTPSAVTLAYNKAVEALNKASTKWSYVQASLSVYGATKLSSAVNSISEELAATPKAVKIAHDKSLQAYEKGTEAVDIANSKWTPQAGTLSQAGIVKLSRSITSKSATVAATSSAVRLAYAKAVSAHVKASKNIVYSGSNPNHTTFPVGTLIISWVGSTIAMSIANKHTKCYLCANPKIYATYSSDLYGAHKGRPLLGTYSYKGYVGAYSNVYTGLFQRVL